MGTAHEQNGMSLAWGAVVRRGLGLGYIVWRGPSSRTRTPSRVRARPGRVAGWCVPSHSPLGLVPDRPWARVARRRKAGGEEEEDARRTFEAGPERPLGVIDDGLPLGPWYLSAVHPLAAWQAGQAGGEESKDQACRGLPSCIP